MKKNLTTKIHPSFVIVLLSTLFILSSCSHKYYAPNEADLLTLREKNDVHFSASFGSAGSGSNTNSGSSINFNIDTTANKAESNSYNFQLGYSPINHLAISGSYFKIKNSNRDNSISGKGNMWNGAIGGYYFKPINDKNNTRKLRIDGKEKTTSFDSPNMRMKKGFLFDLYLGHSRGNVFNFHRDDNCGNCRATSSFKFTKNYAQLGFHYFREIWGLSCAIRLGQLRYFDGDVLGTRMAVIEQDDIDLIQNDNIYPLRETSLRFYMGTKQIRSFFSASIVDEGPFKNLDIVNGIVQLGITVDIDSFFKKSKK